MQSVIMCAQPFNLTSRWRLLWDKPAFAMLDEHDRTRNITVLTTVATNEVLK